MKLVCADGYIANFYKEGNNNLIDFFDNKNNSLGTMFNVSRDWGNWWYMNLQGQEGKTAFDYMWLDLYAYYEDFDCYSDMHKVFYGVRPHLTPNQWKATVQRAKERKL